MKMNPLKRGEYLIYNLLKYVKDDNRKSNFCKMENYRCGSVQHLFWRGCLCGWCRKKDENPSPQNKYISMYWKNDSSSMIALTTGDHEAEPYIIGVVEE